MSLDSLCVCEHAADEHAPTPLAPCQVEGCACPAFELDPDEELLTKRDVEAVAGTGQVPQARQTETEPIGDA
jgi:hypothetical protein